MKIKHLNALAPTMEYARKASVSVQNLSLVKNVNRYHNFVLKITAKMVDNAMVNDHM